MLDIARPHLKLTRLVAFFVTTLCVSPQNQLSPVRAQSVTPETSTHPPDSAQVSDERSEHANLLYQMTTAGIELSEAVSVQLAPPTFATITGEPVDAASAQKALRRIAGPQGVARFTRDSVVAPLFVQTDAIMGDAGERIGHCIDVIFVVHQSIAEIRRSKVLDKFKSTAMDGSKTKSSNDGGGDEGDDVESSMTRSLTNDELSEYGVTLDPEYETLGYLRLPLLEKVVLSGVARARRSVWSADDEAAPVILTWILDSRFASASPEAHSISNQWRAIERTATGQRRLGSPHPYAGMGGYVVLAALPGDAEASIVQIRFVIHEPTEWFQGRNLLRSKLPLLIQDRVRNIRRELED